MKKLEEIGFRALSNCLLLLALAAIAIVHLAMESQEKWQEIKWRLTS